MSNANKFLIFGILLVGLVSSISYQTSTAQAADCGSAPLPPCQNQSPISSPTAPRPGSTTNPLPGQSGFQTPCQPPNCPAPTSSNGSSPTQAGSGNSGPKIGLVGSPPASLTGPFMRSCAGDIVLAWVAPDKVKAQLVVTAGDGEIVYNSEPLKNGVNPLIWIWATEDIRINDPFLFQKIDTFEKGQIYTAKLTLDDSQNLVVPDQILTATFGRKTATDGQCAKPLTDFLFGAGIAFNLPSDDDDSSTINNSRAATGNQTASPKTPGSANQASQGDIEKTPLEIYLASIFGQPVLTLGGRVIRGASLVWWLFEILVILGSILGVYFFLKRHRLWGVVYDGLSKNPIEMTVVRLFDQKDHKLLETRVTPKSGRYSFLAEPGEYYLEVTKEGFHFPSRIVAHAIDNDYTNVYLGRTIKLGPGQSLIAPDIPIDSEAGDVLPISFFRRFVFPALDWARLPILILGIILYILITLLVGAGLLTQNWIGLVGIILLVIFLISEFILIRRGRQ